MRYTINIADDKLKSEVHEWIEKNPDLKYSELTRIMSNQFFPECLIIFECLKNLKSDSYALVSCNGSGYSTHYLYKLNDESVVVIDSGLNGTIHNIKKITSDFENSLIYNLNHFFKVDWEKYHEVKEDFWKKSINSECKFDDPELTPH